MSKPFTYGVALQDRGLAEVLSKIGVEPTGDAFNSISLDPTTGCPLNPMINAGAITAASLVAGHSPEDRIERLLAAYSTYAGRRLAIDPDVYESERATGHRNRAIGHMLRTFDILSGDPEPALDLYFTQCSILVDCRDLSIMAATLANGGVNPITGERAVGPEYVDRILSVMTTCGMYDYSGEWVYSVGMPAKSGVGGGVLVALPGQIGIAVFSPLLDARGNSVRGVEVCKDLSRDAELHFLRVARSSRSVLRAQYSLEAVRSKRVRPEGQREVLRRLGGRVQTYELQGDLLFPEIEAVVRTIVDRSDELDVAVLDFRRVAHVAEPAMRVLWELIRGFRELDRHIALVAASDDLRRFLSGEAAAVNGDRPLLSFDDLDAALEWCEDLLIAEQDGSCPTVTSVSLAEHGLFAGLDANSLEVLEDLVEVRRFETGDLIVRQDDPAREVFLILSGEVSVMIAVNDQRSRRLNTLSAGMTLGELALVAGNTRSADVRADTAVECGVLSTAAFDRLGETHPRIKIALLENILRGAHHMVTQLNREVASLAAE